MNLRHKIFLLLSMLLLGSIILYIWVYARIDYQRLLDQVDMISEQSRYAFQSEQDSTELQMLQIATFVARNEKVQQLFLLGKHAVGLEGGAAGGELSAQVRASLSEEIAPSYNALAEQFGFRQLQFHFAPGALSFLRVHQPEKFGDRMDNIRHTVVAANAEQKTVVGFETGRIVSGIRGVVPVYALDGSIKQRVHVGALESGTSFATMLSGFKKNRPWLDVSVLLSREHLQANIWPEFLAQLLEEKQFKKDFRIEATTSPLIEKFILRDDFATILKAAGRHLLQDGTTSYCFTSFPLRDYLGKTDPTQADAGLIIIWRDISSQLADYNHTVQMLVLFGIILFVTIESGMFYGLKFMTSGLQTELKRTQQLEAFSEKAAQFVVSNMGNSNTHGHLQLQRALQEQLDAAVKAIAAGFGLLLGMGQKADEYRILAVSDMVWSMTSGVELYERVRKAMQQDGFFSLEMKNNQLTRVLLADQPTLLNKADCQKLLGQNFPAGHPDIENLFTIPVVIDGYTLGLLALANSKQGFGQNEQIVAKAYAAAAGLMIHVDQREMHRLTIEESSRLKTEFLSTMSHELRTPMNAIMGFGQLLGNSPLDARQQGFIDKINLSSKSLLNLIDEILLISELESQPLNNRSIESFNPVQLVRRVKDNFIARGKALGVELKTEFSARLPVQVGGHPAALEQVLGQLLGNAIKFSSGGEVTLSLHLLEHDAAMATLEFAVNDQGIGIAAEQQELIFHPFQQGDGSKTRKHGGTGLGLAIARKVCRQLGGDVRVESHLGQGSRFSFCLQFEVSKEVLADPLASSSPLPLVTVEKSSSLALPVSIPAETGALLVQLEEALAKLQAKQCQEISARLKETQWPEYLAEDMNKLQRLISQYRFVEARDVVVCLRELT